MARCNRIGRALARHTGLAVLALFIGLASSASAVTFQGISTGFNHPVGIDHSVPINKVIVSANYSTGLPNNFDLIDQFGAHTPFSSISGLTDEVKIGTVRATGFQSFVPGELFVGTGVDGAVARINPTGTTIINPWVTLAVPGGALVGHVRGGVFHDGNGVAGGDLIVVTSNGLLTGDVFRVTSSGVYSHLFHRNTHLEGVITVPNIPGLYGPWAGTILVGAENLSRIYSINPVTAAADSFDLGIKPEDFDIVPANENFYCVSYAAGQVKGAKASEFASMIGDIIVTQETPGRLYRVHWNGSGFETTQLASDIQFEHSTFSYAGMPPLTDTQRMRCFLSGTATGPGTLEFRVLARGGSCASPLYSYNQSFDAAAGGALPTTPTEIREAVATGLAAVLPSGQYTVTSYSDLGPAIEINPNVGAADLCVNGVVVVGGGDVSFTTSNGISVTGPGLAPPLVPGVSVPALPGAWILLLGILLMGTGFVVTGRVHVGSK